MSRTSDTETRIQDARAGSAAAISQLTEACRQYLLMIANVELDPDVRRKTGASDIVQEALLAAQQSFETFRGSSEAELRRWVRKILVNKIANTCRFYGQAACRNVHREVEINNAYPGEDLIDPHPTPHQYALAAERAKAVETVLNRLPPRCRELIKMRSLEHQPFAEIGAHLGVSTDGARKAWGRALERFRREWEKIVNPE